MSAEPRSLTTPAGCHTGRSLRAASRPTARFALVLLLLVVASPLSGSATEYEVKAAFLFNFLRFVEWPSAAFSDASDPITIGILGDDPFGKALDDTIAGEIVRNRRLVVKRFRDLGDLTACHLLFVSRSESGRLDEVLRQLNRAPVLTVSDIDDFTRHGGVIDFYLERNRIRFTINPVSAQRHGLKLSSQLLSLGKIIHGRAPG